MGQKTGDKGLYYRKRKKRLAKRVAMRELRKASSGDKTAADKPAG
jgi:hypothetical protein